MWVPKVNFNRAELYVSGASVKTEPARLPTLVTHSANVTHNIDKLAMCLPPGRSVQRVDAHCAKKGNIWDGIGEMSSARTCHRQDSATLIGLRDSKYLAFGFGIVHERS